MPDVGKVKRAFDIVDVAAVAPIPADRAQRDVARQGRVDESLAGIAPVAVRDLVQLRGWPRHRCRDVSGLLVMMRIVPAWLDAP